MAKSISPSELGAAIAEQLTVYREGVVERINAAGKKAVKKLVTLTRKTAPIRTGKYVRSITHTETINYATGYTEYTWGVKSPHYRLTHLLVNGHATADGGRTPGDPFLENALNVVMPEYEQDVEEAISDG